MSFYFICTVLLTIFIKFSFADEPDDIDCSKKPCIYKCCERGYLVSPYECNETMVKDLAFADVPIFDEDVEKINSKVNDLFHVIYNSSLSFEDPWSIPATKKSFFNAYLKQDGEVLIEKPNVLNRWIPFSRSKFCLGYSRNFDPVIVVNMYEPDDEAAETENETWSYFVTAAFVVSCIFQLIVLGVYALLPELRNLCGMILMAYIASMFVTYVLFIVLRLLNHIDPEQLTFELCASLSLCSYFAFLSSFFWMHVMSFDIWWTFRGYAKCRAIHRRGELFKFCMYACYAWGTPLFMSIVVAVLYTIDFTDQPWFVKPDIECYFSDGTRLLYQLLPMLILIICNWIFFLLTIYNVWRLNRGTAVLDTAAAGKPADHRSQKSRLMVYVKLSAVMGISWILEIVSHATPTLKVWHIGDLYHALMGVVIFLIFVCKKKILIKVTERSFSKTPEWLSKYYTTTRRGSISYSTSVSDVSQEPLQVCLNPKGEEYKTS